MRKINNNESTGKLIIHFQSEPEKLLVLSKWTDLKGQVTFYNISSVLLTVGLMMDFCSDKNGINNKQKMAPFLPNDECCSSDICHSFGVMNASNTWGIRENSNFSKNFLLSQQICRIIEGLA